MSKPKWTAYRDIKPMEGGTVEFEDRLCDCWASNPEGAAAECLATIGYEGYCKHELACVVLVRDDLEIWTVAFDVEETEDGFVEINLKLPAIHITTEDIHEWLAEEARKGKGEGG